MFNFFKSIFGTKDMSQIKNALSEGAVVVDVRTPQEFAGGHFKDAKNIPLDKISGNVESLKKLKKTIIVCCASGMRSAQAKSILERAGIELVMDAGAWGNLN